MRTKTKLNLTKLNYYTDRTERLKQKIKLKISYASAIRNGHVETPISLVGVPIVFRPRSVTAVAYKRVNYLIYERSRYAEPNVHTQSLCPK